MSSFILACNMISINVYTQAGDTINAGSAQMVPFVLVPLVFKLEDIEKLRSLGICGVLSGTLPTAPQQNMFHSVPLRLMVEEAIWLVLNGYARLNLRHNAQWISQIDRYLADTTNSNTMLAEAQSRLNESFELQRQFKLEQHLKKLEKLGIEKNSNDQQSNANNKSLIESSLFIWTPNETVFSKIDHISNEVKETSQSTILQLLINNYSNWNNYLLFQSLRNSEYFLSPGARFGGLYMAYPGDPLRYHSHLIVKPAIDYYNDPINFIELIASARLGTNVKKLIVIGGIKNSTDTDTKENRKEDFFNDDNGMASFFSIEWTGFG